MYLSAVFDFEDLDEFVWGAGGEAGAIVVHLSVVDHVLVTSVHGALDCSHDLSACNDFPSCSLRVPEQKVLFVMILVDSFLELKAAAAVRDDV